MCPASPDARGHAHIMRWWIGAVATGRTTERTTGRANCRAGPVVVPDDARELARDVEAWRREQRWDRRSARSNAASSAGRVERARSSAAGHHVVARRGDARCHARLSRPRRRVASNHRPCNSCSRRRPPRPGRSAGCCPMSPGRSAPARRARAVRPALLALVRANCRCDRALAHLTDEAAATASPSISSRRRRSDRLRSTRLPPRSAARTCGYCSTRQSASGRAPMHARPSPSVAVHADGVIDDVLTDLTDTAVVDSAARHLKQPAHAGA